MSSPHNFLASQKAHIKDVHLRKAHTSVRTTHGRAILEKCQDVQSQHRKEDSKTKWKIQCATKNGWKVRRSSQKVLQLQKVLECSKERSQVLIGFSLSKKKKKKKKKKKSQKKKNKSKAEKNKNQKKKKKKKRGENR